MGGKEGRRSNEEKVRRQQQRKELVRREQGKRERRKDLSNEGKVKKGRILR